MQYPDDFAAECRRVYPGWKALHKQIAQGAAIVGRYLDDSRTNGIDFDVVLAASTLQELQEKARALKERSDLYLWWTRLYQDYQGARP